MGGCLSWLIESFSGADSAPRTITINRKQYTIISLLGEGGYATVYRARGPNGDVALKRIRFSAERRVHVEEEVKFLKLCETCPYIIDLIDFEIRGGNGNGTTVVNMGDNDDDDDNNNKSGKSKVGGLDGNKHGVGAVSTGSSCDGEGWLVLELCGDSAFNMLQDKINQVRLMQRGAKAEGCLPLEQVLAILDSVIHAVAFLHRMQPNPIAHWDLKLQNFLRASAFGANLTSGDLPAGAYKLCDFGSATQHRIAPCANAKHVNASSIILDERLTLAYRPPESLDLWSRHSVDTKADTWAIGVLIYTLLCARLPFEENARQIIDNTMIPFPEAFAHEGNQFKELAKIVKDGLLVTDPMARWNIFDLSKKLNELYPSAHSQVEEAPHAPLAMLDFPMPTR